MGSLKTEAAGVILAALLPVWGAFAYYREESAYQRKYPDAWRVQAQVARFAAFRSAVPENAILGYFSNAQPGSALDQQMRLSAQYVLAPRLLETETGPELVLGNLTGSPDRVALGRARGLRVERDFGNGVVLYRKER
jgi:hypothetical protein